MYTQHCCMGPGQRRVKAFASGVNSASGNEASSFASSCRRPEMSACVSPRKSTEASRSRAVVASVAKRVQECAELATFPRAPIEESARLGLPTFCSCRAGPLARSEKQKQFSAHRHQATVLSIGRGRSHGTESKAGVTEEGREEPTHMRSNPLVGPAGSRPGSIDWPFRTNPLACGGSSSGSGHAAGEIRERFCGQSGAEA